MGRKMFRALLAPQNSGVAQLPLFPFGLGDSLLQGLPKMYGV
jgi:hypothetical protein